ncbi:hypothetical protein QR680_011268 [Steinernema hermaphroditum]|uniref:Uncharacterized protein n=1 Tax=Steinernema hermaphroditum TaxID=289476 RepID=A0AA39IT68_9BILA|nr:hypothetical protein QR680_011268 [Steinernema hermaphroditum]
MRAVYDQFDNVKSAVYDQFDNVKSAVYDQFDNVKSAVCTQFDNVKSAVYDQFDNVKSAVCTQFDNVKSAVYDQFDNVKSAVCTQFDNVKSAVYDQFDNVKSAVCTQFDNVKSAVYDQFDNVKSAVCTQFDNVKSAVCTQFDNVKSAVYDQFDNVKSAVCTQFDNVKSAVCTQFDNVKSAVYDQFDNVKRAVYDQFDQMDLSPVPSTVCFLRRSSSHLEMKTLSHLTDFFSRNQRRSRNHGYTLTKPAARSIESRFFSSRVINDWNALPASIINSATPKLFRSRIRNHVFLDGRRWQYRKRRMQKTDKAGSFTPLPATSLLSRSHPALLEHVEAWKLHIVIDSLGTDVDKPEGRGDPVRSSAHSPDEREQEDTVMLEYLQRPQGPDETTDQAEELLAQLIEIRRKLRSTGARSTYCIASEICRPTSTIPAIAPEALVIASKAIATAPAS